MGKSTPPDSDSASGPFSVSLEGRRRRATVCASCLQLFRRRVLLLEGLLWKRLEEIRRKRRGEEILLLLWEEGTTKRKLRGSEAEALRIVWSRLYTARWISSGLDESRQDR